MKPQRPASAGLPVVSRLRRYPLPAARLALRAIGMGHLGIRHSVALRRVLYLTTAPDGRPTVASGLVATPIGTTPHAVVCYQHGTQGHRVNVPSTPHRLEGVLAAMVFAGAGYVLAAPDYQGLGSSPGPHPYLHAQSEAASVTDLLAALPRALADAGSPVPDRAVLLGFSQGGHATLAALQALTDEPQEIEIVGAASVAGVHRLLETSGPHTLTGVSRHHSTYLAYLATAYARISGQPLSSIVTQHWARRLPTLWDGSHGLAQVARQLPREPTQLLNKETIADLSGPAEGWFARMLGRNSVGSFATDTPVRFYVGSQDIDIPAEDSMRTAELMRARGVAAHVEDVGAVDHKGTALAAVGRARRWFDELLVLEPWEPRAPGSSLRALTGALSARWGSIPGRRRALGT